MVWLWANITTGHVAKTGKPDLKPAKPRALNDEDKKRGWVVVNALPPLKVVQLLGNACLSPTTLAPKDPFRSRGPRWILLFSLFSEEPHWLIPNDLVGALGAMPAAWLATVSRRCHSVDVFQQGRFLFPCQPLTSPLPKEPITSYQGPALFQGSFIKIIIRLYLTRP